MSETRTASTGSTEDDTHEDRHEGVIEHTSEVVAVPGLAKRQRIVLDGISYAHVAEDAAGRWIYRAV